MDNLLSNVNLRYPRPIRYGPARAAIGAPFQLSRTSPAAAIASTAEWTAGIAARHSAPPSARATSLGHTVAPAARASSSASVTMRGSSGTTSGRHRPRREVWLRRSRDHGFLVHPHCSS